MRKSSRTGSERRTGPTPIGRTKPGEPPGDVGAAPRKPADAGAQPLEGLGVETGDARLVECARGGDDAAFGVLVMRYERKLVRVLTRLVRDGELARDLAQETFWRVYNRLDRFDTARRFGPWLFRVGVNLGLDWLRRPGATTAAPLSIDRPPGDGLPVFDLPDPDPRLQADLAQEVQFVLARIPVTYRTILVLRDLEGFSSAEVAAIVSRREATIRWRLAKAREMFRDQWERRQGATSWSSGPSRPGGD
jgi:RNA polymerase sigma-70 factor (ECF subfamily)